MVILAFPVTFVFHHPLVHLASIRRTNALDQATGGKAAPAASREGRDGGGWGNDADEVDFENGEVCVLVCDNAVVPAKFSGVSKRLCLGSLFGLQLGTIKDSSKWCRGR